MTIVLLGAGVRSLNRLPVDAYPDLSPPMVEIITQWPGHAAEEVERLITVPTEREMNGLPRLTTSRSISLYGLSDVILTFENGTDDYFARQQVYNRVGELTLPSGVSPTPGAAVGALRPDLPLCAAEHGPLADGAQDLRGLDHRAAIPIRARGRGRLRLRRRHHAVPGAARSGQGRLGRPVGTAGGRCADGQQWQRRRRVLFAGRPVLLRARHGAPQTLEDIGNVVVAVHDGTPVLVKDVGRVVIGIAPRLGEFGYQEQDDAVEGVILLRTGEKTQDVLQGVEAKTRELNSAILPNGRQGRSVLRPQRSRRPDQGGRRSATCCAACCWSSRY